MADWCLSLCPEAGSPPIWERGALLGAVRVVGWVRTAEARRRPVWARWVVAPEVYTTAGQPDGWCLIVEDPRPLPTPIPMRGLLGRFPLPEPVTIPE